MKLTSVGVALATSALLVVAACGGSVGSSGPSGLSADGGSQERQASATRRGFTFAASGDLGANRHTSANLRMLNRSAARFFLALGDLDYDQTPTDRAWCGYVKRGLPAKFPRYPFEVLVGNHEEDGGEDGRIANFARCLPDRLHSDIGPRSRYGAEYSFTYPRHRPLMKVIMIAPGMRVNGVQYSYTRGTPHRRWLSREIRQARTRGIHWVVVGMHYPCITTGLHQCDAGEGILNFLVRRRVDLVLVGHNHMYERSKQLRLSKRCRHIGPRDFDAGCVADAGRDGRYREGRGTVFITAGTFGGHKREGGGKEPDRPYFAAVNDQSYGFVRYRVRRGSIHGRYVRSAGHFHDSFSIVRR